MNKNTSLARLILATLGASLFGLSLSVQAGNVSFRKIYDVRQTPPGVILASNQIMGMLRSIENAPVFDGRYVVFPLVVAGVPPFASHLWSYDTITGRMFRIADDSTLFPGTDGIMKGYFLGAGFAPFNVDASKIVFTARATTSTGDIYGFLSKPANGLNPTILLADTRTPIPSAQGIVGNFSRFAFSPDTQISQDNGYFVFNKSNASYDGSYGIPSIGGTVKEIADNILLGIGFQQTCCYISDYSNHRLVADTFNVFGTGPIVTIKDDRTELQTIVSAERGEKVPKDPENRVFDIFRLQAPQIENRHIVFQGAALPHVAGSTRDLAGLYSFVYSDLLPRPSDPNDKFPPYAPGRIIRLVDSNMAIPGGVGNFTRDDPFLGTLAGGGFSFSGRSVFFMGRDQANKHGLYHVAFNGGKITKIVANGDTLPDGRVVVGVNGTLTDGASIQVDSAHNDEVAVRLTVNAGGSVFSSFDAIYLLGSQGLPTSPVLCNGLRATIIGTSGNNIINGTSGRDIIAGLGGNDTINGLAGNDVICGGDGDDTLNGANGTDILLGEAGSDTCISGETNLTCETLQ